MCFPSISRRCVNSKAVQDIWRLSVWPWPAGKLNVTLRVGGKTRYCQTRKPLHIFTFTFASRHFSIAHATTSDTQTTPTTPFPTHHQHPHHNARPRYLHRQHRLATHSSRRPRAPRILPPLSSVQGLLHHPDDDQLFTYLLQLMYTTLPVAGGTMSRMP